MTLQPRSQPIPQPALRKRGAGDTAPACSSAGHGWACGEHLDAAARLYRRLRDLYAQDAPLHSHLVATVGTDGATGASCVGNPKQGDAVGPHFGLGAVDKDTVAGRGDADTGQEAPGGRYSWW